VREMRARLLPSCPIFNLFGLRAGCSANSIHAKPLIPIVSLLAWFLWYKRCIRLSDIALRS
jgi:hypothetical protein